MKNNVVLLAEPAADISANQKKEYGIEMYKIPVMINDENYEYDLDLEDGYKDFYNQLRAGGVVKTAAVSPFGYREILEKYLKQGKDVLYVAYSGNISGALNYFNQAADELKEEYPERKITLIDTLSLSYGIGYLVIEAAKMLKAGKTVEEIVKHIEKIKFKSGVVFTPETLTYLKRGGRLSGAKATIGNILNLKPILSVTNEGVLDKVSQVSGRRKSFVSMIDMVEKLGEKLSDTEITVLHSDCEEDAKILSEMIKQRVNPKNVVFHSIGPIIGAHCGPGTVGIHFIASRRSL